MFARPSLKNYITHTSSVDESSQVQVKVENSNVFNEIKLVDEVP